MASEPSVCLTTEGPCLLVREVGLRMDESD